MKKYLALTGIISFIMLINSCNPKLKADLFIFNANIYTVDSNFSKAQALCIKNGKIIDIGETNILKTKYVFDEQLDIKEKYIYPGFIDPHCHIYGYAISLRQANIKKAQSFEEVILKLKKHNKDNPKSKWIVGNGWDQNIWKNKQFPNKTKLDEVFPDKPVFITRIDGHAALLNSKAMDIVKFDKNTKIAGGIIEVKNGDVTGIILDKACDKARNFITAPETHELNNLLIKAQQNCIKVGLTTIADAGLDKKIIDIIKKLQQSKDFKVRLYAMLTPSKENFSEYIEKGIVRTDYLHIRSIKLYADGALGSRGAALLKPYSDAPNNYGIMLETKEKIQALAEKAKKYGYQLNTHAIGDSAVRTVLDIYSNVLKGKNDLRWRIEHAQIVNYNDLNKFGENAIIPAVNTTHATSDMFWAEKRLGERIKYAYAYKDLLEQNDWFCNGSDFPIEHINPLYGFYAATARKNVKGMPQKGFQPENAINRKQALKAMTIWAAKACFEEDVKGSIEKNKFADFVVLDKNIMEIPLEEVLKTKVLKTFIAGKQQNTN